MGSLKALISGAGIAGPVVAHFLAQAGATVTVIERAPALRTGGQSIDIRGHALTVVERMGVDAAIRSRITQEKGLRFVDAQNRSQAEFPVGDGDGFTAEIEIARGDLAEILYDATKERVEYVFGERVSSLREDAEGVEVEFENGRAPLRVDVVIAADGWSSVTRKLAFGEEVSRSSVKELGQWAAWCTIPRHETDQSWARWYNAPGKRMILLRPYDEENSRVSLWVMPKHEKLDAVAKTNAAEQKAYWGEVFKDAGWEADRVVEAVSKVDDFYMQKIAQVKMSKWSRGRVVVVGDAGYCPSPISGMGTTVAVVGAYILAGELAKSPKDPTIAFQEYERRMRPLVDRAQKLSPGAPSLANPETALGIRILNLFLGFIAWTRAAGKLMSSDTATSAIDLPDYNFRPPA